MPNGNSAWERFFEDLEDQLDSEWEAERAALDSEAERLRLSRITLRERLVPLAVHGDRALAIETADGTLLTGRLTALGADWAAVDVDARRAAPVIVPLHGVVAIGMARADVVGSARDAAVGSALQQRMTFAFVLRDLARRRVPVTVQTLGGRALSGTVDRAGADHLDLALHDAGAPRRTADVTGYRLVMLASISWARPDAPTALP